MTKSTSTLEQSVEADKTSARVVGVLFIIATVAAALTVVLLGSILEGADYLLELSANSSTVLVAALLDLVTAAAVTAIAVVLFPVLRRYSPAAAVGYVASRSIEAVILIMGAISLLAMLTMSQAYVNSGATDESGLELIGTLLLGMRDWTFYLGPVIAFGATALILNYVFYRSLLVPRWISIWGLIGGLLILVGGVIHLFGHTAGDPIPASLFLFSAPIAVNEMVLAIWLIVKGYNPNPEAAPDPS